MIDRYLDKSVEEIWSFENKLKTWFDLEVCYINAFFNNKNCDLASNFTEEDLIFINSFHKNFVFDKNSIRDIHKIEKQTRHDFVSFLKYIEDKANDRSMRWLHFGLTSSDIIDTTNSINCIKTLELITTKLVAVITILKDKINSKSADTEILARTHGQAAEIQTLKQVYKRWLSFAQRAFDKVIIARQSVNVGKLSGAVGNYSFNNREIERITLSYFNLQPFLNASQVISRDVYLDYFYALLNVMLFIDKIANDIRIYAISEINEIAEGFSQGQKGSSAMPHKKNPIYTENLHGLTVLFKGMFDSAIANCNTLLERDISHSASERIIFPDAAHIASFSLNRLMSVLNNLVVNKDNCKNNIDKNRSKIESQNILAEKINEGFSRFESHNISQERINKC